MASPAGTGRRWWLVPAVVAVAAALLAVIAFADDPSDTPLGAGDAPGGDERAGHHTHHGPAGPGGHNRSSGADHGPRHPGAGKGAGKGNGKGHKKNDQQGED